jgi:hypothetical protein
MEANDELWGVSERRQSIACNTGSTKFLALDSGLTFDGEAFSATLQREALSLVGKTRTGQIVVDYKKIKMFKRLWIKATGGPIHVRVGAAMLVDGPITWQPQVTFDPETDVYVDLIVTGRALAVEFETTDSVPWTLESYKVEFNVQGNF